MVSLLLKLRTKVDLHQKFLISNPFTLNVTDSEHEPVANTSKIKANRKTTRKQDTPQKRQIVTDKVAKRAMKQTANKIAKTDVCTSNKDEDKQAEIDSRALDSDEDLHVAGPVESFARICQV